MSAVPEFPFFKTIELDDRGVFENILKAYMPDASEWTFTNLFIWRSHYNYSWSLHKDWLIVTGTDEKGTTYAMQPVGPASRVKVVSMLFEWLKEEIKADSPRIERADERLVKELDGVGFVSVVEERNHFDYVYLRDDLAKLEGNKYRSKRNRINQFLKSHSYKYESLKMVHISECLEVQEKWCQKRRCWEDLNLIGEWDAVREVLAHFDGLGLKGAVILIGGKVVAFTVGELLNRDTAVIHIEKADPDITGLFQLINQQFCAKSLDGIKYINREQDLGLPGLREAKLSYFSDHFVKKYSVILKV